VSEKKSRPPSGIMFAVFGAVKQFLSLLTLFSLDFYSESKRPKNKANMLNLGRSPESQNSFRSRKKISFLAGCRFTDFPVGEPALW
jgi:hypothetical protein